MIAPMRYFEGDLEQAVCRRDDVDGDWWIEPEYAKNEPGGSRGVIEARENMTRAKILCYTCPLLDACREYGWLEGHHVWGGLDGVERYKVLKAGTTAVLPRASKGRFLDQKDWILDFLRGDPVEKIAANEGKTVSTVGNRIRGTLAALREEREDHKWSSQRRLPKLPKGMSMAEFRHGVALSQTSASESA